MTHDLAASATMGLTFFLFHEAKILSVFALRTEIDFHILFLIGVSGCECLPIVPAAIMSVIFVPAGEGQMEARLESNE